MNESRRSRVYQAEPCFATWPYIINLLGSRSSFPNGACLHFSHVRLGKWDTTLNPTGHYAAPQLTTVLYSCQPETFTGARRGSELLNRVQTRKFIIPELSTHPIPSKWQHFTLARQLSPSETAQNMGEGCLREFLCEKLSRNRNLCILVNSSFGKTWSWGSTMKEFRAFYNSLIALS